MTESLPTRRLGANGKVVSALGLGCWAIGGPFYRGAEPLGYGAVDDHESLRAMRRALDLGVTLFDTSDFYGCGHSERLLARALPARRDGLTIVTKFGYRCDETTRQVTGHLDLPGELHIALAGSLARLATERLDLWLLHLRDFPLDRVDDLIAALETECDRGRIGAYGWSTDDPARAAAIARGAHCLAIEHALNVLQGERSLVAFTRAHGLASLARSPLAMGRLADSARTIGDDDIRSRFAAHDPREEAIRRALDAARAVLTKDGRSLAQGALAAVLACGDHVIPIPGFRTVAQVEENVATLTKPALSAADLATLDAVTANLDLPPDPLASRRR
jgi:aryl-alcohol dehydrogenase-like predicted oxidoreductase